MCNERNSLSCPPVQYQFLLGPIPPNAPPDHPAPETEICFELWGFLGRDIASEILEMIKPYFEERRNIVLDLSAVHGIDSAGIAVLVECLRMGSESRRGFRIIGINKTVKEILDMVRIHTLFKELEITQLPEHDAEHPRIVNRLNLRGVS